MKLLNNEAIIKYDYKKTKANVDDFMKGFEENYFKYISVLPPNITSHLCEIRVQMSRVSSSPVEKYVIKKISSENDFIEYLNAILNIVDNLTNEEQHYFKGSYFLGNSESLIAEELRCAKKRIVHIKKSAIIKFALAIDRAVEIVKT